MISKFFSSLSLKAIFIIAFLFIFSSSLYSQSSIFKDRYLWVVRTSMVSKKSIDEMIQFAVLNRFNNIVIQVRGRGDAFYNSKFVPKSSLIKDLDFDPLAYVLPAAKEKGLKVHVWLNTYLLWSSSVKPIQNEHLANTKIEWIDHNQLQNKSLKELLIDNKNRKNGFEGIYLSPGHPNVNKYLLKVFKELVDEYDIDGIHLDYIRLHDQGYGKNPYAIANFRKYNNSNNQIDALSLDQYSSQEWNDFLRKSITELVSDTKDMIMLSNSRIELSAAVKPSLYEARERFSQEWDVWLVAGYLDKAFVMNYAADLKIFAANIDIMYDNLPKKYRDRVVVGIATYNQSAEEALTKVKYAKVTRFSSVAFFSYNSLAQSKAYFQTIKNYIYK
ncbi:MAG: glycoside hydrolase family 10 protein [Candidatus Neomarinimicrobiota bacterium]|nr:MAG: hypothetical protein CBC68_05385 [Candidatus Marinimicrobia bacterium TMED108]RCL90325.1 MAG: hypothetical protein DBW60_02060 [bacterium]